MFNRMDKFSNQCFNCMGLYNKHKHTVSSRQHYHKEHSMLPQASLGIPVVNRSTACLHSFSQANSPQNTQTKIPIKSPLMPTQTSQITIPLQPFSARHLVKDSPPPPICLGKMMEKWIMDEDSQALINRCWASLSGAWAWLNCTNADLMFRHRHCQIAPGKRGLDSGVYTFNNLLHNTPVK